MSRISCVVPDAYASIEPLLMETIAMFEVIIPSNVFEIAARGRG